MSLAPQWDHGPELLIDPEPALVIADALDPVDVVAIGDGQIVIVDRMMPGLRIYDKRGTLLRTSGQEGTGPGEFVRPEKVSHYRGDTIAVFDPASSRLNLFTSGGEFGRTILIASGYSGVSFLGSISDGSFVFRGRAFEERGRNWREPTQIFAIGANGGEISPFATVPGWEFYRVKFGGRTLYGVTPFGPRTTAIAFDEGVWVHSQEDCSIQFFNEDGQVTKILRNTCEQRPLPRDEILHFQQTRPERFVRPEDRELWGRIYRSRQVPYPKRIPAFQNLLEGPSGRLWAEQYPLQSDTARVWEIFGEDGQWLGSVRVLADLEIVRVQEGTAFCLVQDHLGRRSVQAHDLLLHAPPQASSTGGDSGIISHHLGTG